MVYYNKILCNRFRYVGVIMNIFKSILVFAFLLILVVTTSCSIVKTIRRHRIKMLNVWDIIVSLICVAVTLICIVSVGKYINPFDQKIDVTLVAEYRISEKYQSTFPGQQFWHGAYDGGFFPDSEYFNTKTMTKYDLKMPFMNLRRHSYIITYGQKIEELICNVWETIDYPSPTGAMVGRISFEDGFKPQTMYVYETEKIRIENDINKTFISSASIPPKGNIFWFVLLVCVGAVLLETGLYWASFLKRHEDRLTIKKTGDGSLS